MLFSNNNGFTSLLNCMPFTFCFLTISLKRLGLVVKCLTEIVRVDRTPVFQILVEGGSVTMKYNSSSRLFICTLIMLRKFSFIFSLLRAFIIYWSDHMVSLFFLIPTFSRTIQPLSSPSSSRLLSRHFAMPHAVPRLKCQTQSQLSTCSDYLCTLLFPLPLCIAYLLQCPILQITAPSTFKNFFLYYFSSGRHSGPLLSQW